MPNPPDRRQRPTAAVLWSALLGGCLAASPAAAQNDNAHDPLTPAAEAPPDTATPVVETPPAVVPLPAGLPADLRPPEPGSDAARRLSVAREEALSQFSPTDFGEAQVAADQAVPPAVEQAVTQALELLDDGRHFEAFTRLREAERVAPDHPRVVRTLGLACVRGGNTVRGEAYLRRAAAMDPLDTDARVVLARLALDRRAWEDAASLAASILVAAEQADTPDPAAALFAHYTQATALDRLGYTDAAITLYGLVLSAQDAPNPASAAGRELYILKRQAPTIRQRVGDLHLRRDAPDLALAHYQPIDPAELLDPAGLAARLAYTYLTLGEPEQATQRVVDFLASPAASDADASLITYLVAQGADPATLDALLVSASEKASPGHFPLIAARSVVLSQSDTVVLIDAWLAAQPPRIESFRRAIALLRGGGASANDPEALAYALALTAGAMQRQPPLAPDYADALLSQTIDPVALIRALRRPEVDAAQGFSQQLLSAMAYARVGRAQDAHVMYRRALDQQPGHPAATLGIVRALILLGWQDPQHYEAAQDYLGQPAANAPWERFALQIQLYRATDQDRAASALVQSRLRLNGPSLELLMLKADLAADSGGLTQAAPVIQQVVEAYPTDESTYYSAAHIVLRVGKRQEKRLVDAFLMTLRDQAQAQVTDTSAARYMEALALFHVELRAELAIDVLEPLLAEAPDDAGLLGLLSMAYSVVGQTQRADELKLRWIKLLSPGAYRASELAQYYLGRDDDRAAAIVREAISLSEEGVLPGPPLNGGYTSVLLSHLTLAVGEEVAEPDYLRALRRFPNDPSLNNALGYRWAVAGKELLAAEAMLLRAIEHSEEPSSAVLDSLGWVYYKMGRFADAEQYLRQAIVRHREEMREPGAADGGASKAIHYDHLGDILYRQGETASAVRHWVIARGQDVSVEDASRDPESATVVERCAAKVLAVQQGLEPEVSEVPGEAAFGTGGHPSDTSP